MHIDHLRYGSDDDGTPGRIRVHQSIQANDLFDSFAIERPWLLNQRHVSCVPAGGYTLEAHTYKQGTKQELETWALVNEELGVYHYPSPRASRDLILLHPANRSDQLQGCIAPVAHITKKDGKLFGPSSGPTLSRFLNVINLNQAEHTYEIRWAGAQR